MKIKITSDRMIDLTNEELSELNISCMSCYINMGNKSFNDLIDVFPQDVFDFVAETGTMAKTAAKSPDDYYNFFEPFLEEYDEIIHFSASSGISSICENAGIASGRLDNRIHVIDSRNLSSGIAIMAKYAIDLVNQGLTAGEVAEKTRQFVPRVNGSFLIEDLVFLYKGGRCSTLTFYAANLLRIKPVIYLAPDGKMTVREKILGSHDRAVEKYVKHTLELNPPELDFVYFTLAQRDEKQEQAALAMLNRLGYAFKEVYFHEGSCNCCVHSGRNSIGMFYVNKE